MNLSYEKFDSLKTLRINWSKKLGYEYWIIDKQVSSTKPMQICYLTTYYNCMKMGQNDKVQKDVKTHKNCPRSRTKRTISYLNICILYSGWMKTWFVDLDFAEPVYSSIGNRTRDPSLRKLAPYTARTYTDDDLCLHVLHNHIWIKSSRGNTYIKLIMIR